MASAKIYPASQDLPEDVESDVEDSQPLVGYGVSWMVYYLLLTVPIYWIIGDSQNRHYTELANRYIPIGYILTCVAIIYARISKNFMLVWSPITWFFLGSGLTYGMGPLIYYYGESQSVRLLDVFWIMDDATLLRTNMLNSVGTFFVCVGHRLMLASPWRPSGGRSTREGSLALAERMFKAIVVVALPLKLYIYTMRYIDPNEYAIPAFVEQIANLCNVCITLSFFIWQSGKRGYAWISIALLASDSLFSLLAFSKAFLIVPFIQATIGVFMARKRFVVLVVGFLIVVGLYMWVKPLVDMGRSEFSNRQQRLSYRVQFVSDFLNGNLQQSSAASIANTEHWWVRQSFSSTEAYLMNSYDNGHPGQSIRDAWIVFIPRFLWPDKPQLFSPGYNLNYELVGNDKSSLAATLYGEAYWNGGWLMVVFVSMYVGGVFCILARMSIYYMSVLDMRWLPAAVMGIYYGVRLDEWFVSTFVGYIPLIIGIWILMKVLFAVREAEE